MFPYISLFETYDPRDEANFWPYGHNLNMLGRDLQDEAIYPISML